MKATFSVSVLSEPTRAEKEDSHMPVWFIAAFEKLWMEVSEQKLLDSFLGS